MKQFWLNRVYKDDRWSSFFIALILFDGFLLAESNTQHVRFPN